MEVDDGRRRPRYQRRFEGSEVHGEDSFPFDQRQLKLDLGMPWDGRSPRYLTRAAELFSLASEGTGRSIRDVPLVVQLELFPEGTSYGS